MKILILANNDVGLYKFRKELIQELIRKGHRVVVSLPDGELIQDIKKLGVKVILTDVDRRGINPLTDLKLMVKYLRMGLTLRPDLVITYTIKPNVYGGLICRVLKIPYAENITGLGITFQQENIIKKLVCFLYKLSCSRAQVVFFENEENKQIFLDNHLIREEQAYRLNGARVNLDTVLGEGVIINTGATVDHDNYIGDYAHVSVGAHLAGTVSLGRHSWIGAGAVVSNNVSICDSAMIGAGTVVIKDIMECGTYIGVPSRKIK